MKKLSVIALVCALAMMISVPFGAFADEPAFSLSSEAVSGKVGDEVVVEVDFAMGEGVYLLNGEFTITYPADKLDLVIGEKVGLADPTNKLCTLTGVTAEVKADEEKGEILIAFMDSSAMALAEMTDKVLAKLPFIIKDGAEGKIEITVESTNLMRTDDGITGIDALAEAGGTIAGTATVEVAAAPTTAAPTTAAPTTAAPTTVAPTTAAPTTKAPTPAGEATPWALLATVSVAGAALVVLSTKKSK